MLRLLESCDLGELARAVDRALAIGALTVEAIRLLLQDGREAPAKYFRLDGRPHLQGRVVPPPNWPSTTPCEARRLAMKKLETKSTVC